MRLNVFAILVLSVGYSLSHASAPEKVAQCSLIRLIGNPAELDGRMVQVSGYLAEAQGLHLFLTHEYAEAYDRMSAIQVRETFDAKLIQSDCHPAFVTLQGRYSSAQEPGESAHLTEVQWVTKVKDRERCWEAKVD